MHLALLRCNRATSLDPLQESSLQIAHTEYGGPNLSGLHRLWLRAAVAPSRAFACNINGRAANTHYPLCLATMSASTSFGLQRPAVRPAASSRRQALRVNALFGKKNATTTVEPEAPAPSSSGKR